MNDAPTAAQWAQLTEMVRGLIETVRNIDKKTEQIVIVDKDVTELKTKVGTIEKNVTQLWDKVNEERQRWERHDQDATTRTHRQDEAIAAQLRAMNETFNRALSEVAKTAEESNKSVQDIRSTFKGVGLSWMVIGGLLISGVGWIFSKVDELSVRVTAIEVRADTNKGKGS